MQYCYVNQTTVQLTYVQQALMQRDGSVLRITNQSAPEAPPDQLPLQQVPRPNTRHQDVKRYQQLKLRAGLAQSLLVFVLIFALVASGLTSTLEEAIRNRTGQEYAVLLIFALILGVVESIVSFPLRYYSSFLLEHRYGLSNQTFGAWLWQRAKGSLVGAPFFIFLLALLYYCLDAFGPAWWLPVAAVLFIVSVVLARVAPVLIFPLFYTFRPLEEGPLRDRLLALCTSAGVAVRGLFVFNMSKTTKKANAAFTGIGRAKRIILGDTLVANFTDEEIETIFAHELGHQTMNHLWTMMALGTLTTFVGLFLAAQLYDASLAWFGFGSRQTIAALPLLGLWLGLISLVTTPLTNIVSRAHERRADAYAVRLTQNKNAFLSALNKLGRMNMADHAPHPAVEFLFYSHPSLDKRIQAVEAL
ncbi:MAG: peptidase M48 [Bacteroidia bacterium]|nr:MAG: peptidase M48 [Bacteroidia bacterium]